MTGIIPKNRTNSLWINLLFLHIIRNLRSVNLGSYIESMDKNTFSVSEVEATIVDFYPDVRIEEFFVDKLDMTLNNVALET